MKFVLYFAIGWCVVCGFAGEALANDGNALLGHCKTFLAEDNRIGDYGSGIEYGACVGYIGGVKDSFYIWHVATVRISYCLPEEAEFDQLVRVVVKWLEDNPASLHHNAAGLVRGAFSEAFPCPEAE